MGGLRLKIHPLFYLFGLYYALTGRVFVFVVYTLCAVVHEIGHSIAAGNLGYALKRITLMPFGAVITGDIENLRPVDEIKVAVMGPLVNLITAFLFIALWWVFPELYAFTDIVVEASLSLAIINFLPVFPLDGGRILKGALRSRLKRKTADNICKGIGVAMAVLFLGLFVFSCFNKINLSLLFFCLFIIFSVFNRDKENSYAKIYSSLSTDRLKRGAEIKRIAVDKSVTLKKLLTMLSPDAVNEVVVYSNGVQKAVITQERLSFMLERGEIYKKIESYL
ncbi:MAG: hypothetical protein E7369_00325 [Clostridiales bacterium]|nr:hypothetical protein [Clostridiales bacterium]